MEPACPNIVFSRYGNNTSLCNFTLDDETTEAKATLPTIVYVSICEFQSAIQSRKFHNQSQASTNHLELSMNNIISSTYLLHGAQRIKSKGSELNLIASAVATFSSPFFSAHDRVQMKFDAVSWVFKQGEVADEDKLRPDILIHAEQHGKVVKVACGEVKNINTTQEKLNEDRMRVLEIMKRQLHIRLRHAKSFNEAVSFRILVQGHSVTLLRMTMDLAKGA